MLIVSRWEVGPSFCLPNWQIVKKRAAEKGASRCLKRTSPHASAAMAQQRTPSTNDSFGTPEVRKSPA
ncbi:MAG: hypothetical protein LBQ50_08435 [Planctomycetaceae bacterium]|nr:hypothetical protein [Planctomycetaceae bacterium]